MYPTAHLDLLQDIMGYEIHNFAAQSGWGLGSYLLVSASRDH